ncbi:MAG: cbb3-type cytochrome c oxidase subunit 3 [Alphaproteobacteria bacterium]
MKELFASANMGLIGLLFFFGFFCLMLIWVLRPGAKSKYKKDAEIPLKEDE